jgi:hypothetical protein
MTARSRRWANNRPAQTFSSFDGDYSCARRTPPTAGQGWMFKTEVAPATASQQLASLMDAHAYHDLVGVISLYRVLKCRARARHIGELA